jgi:hypothetical protein
MGWMTNLLKDSIETGYSKTLNMPQNEGIASIVIWKWLSKCSDDAAMKRSEALPIRLMTSQCVREPRDRCNLVIFVKCLTPSCNPGNTGAHLDKYRKVPSYRFNKFGKTAHSNLPRGRNFSMTFQKHVSRNYTNK